MPKSRVRVRVQGTVKTRVTRTVTVRTVPVPRPIGYGYPAVGQGGGAEVYCEECDTWTSAPTANIPAILCDGECGRMLLVSSS
jgi:hypothetical protein